MKLSRDKTVLRQIEASDIDKNGYFKVPDSVIVIGERAGARKDTSKLLKTIDINNTKKVCLMAFCNCINLETVIGSPENIGNNAFSRCKKLAKFDFSNTKELGEGSFGDSGITSIDLSGIENVPLSAFGWCEELCEVIGSPKVIGQNAFYNCKITNIDLRRVEIVSDYAFANCKELCTVVGSPQTIGAYSFHNCKKLSKFDFSQATVLGEGSFADSGITSIDLGRIVNVPDYAFGYCAELREVIGSPKVIGQNAFVNCTKLEDFDFHNVERLDEAAFFGSKISYCISIVRNIISVDFKGYKARFATASHHSLGHIIEGIIDEDKNAYVDKHGNPLIIDTEWNEKIMFNDNKKQFLKLWNAS